MNIYDDKDFFKAYAMMDRSSGLDKAGEWYMFKTLIPDVKDMTILDLGCGYGWHSKYLINSGASKVIAIDGSERMLVKARKINSDPNIEYMHMAIESYDYPIETFDVVISNLALHYIEDLDQIYEKVNRTLKKGGYFIFNIEHPTFTSGINEDFIYDENGKALYYPIDDYFKEGIRDTLFLDHHVLKYHHTLETIINGLIKSGFNIESLLEAKPSIENKDIMPDEFKRPMMLLIRGRKI